MKSECPKEYNVEGQHKGPSCNGKACSKFILDPVVEEREKKEK